jgi:hypothetical protein
MKAVLAVMLVSILASATPTNVPASTSVDSIIVAQDFNPGYNLDSSKTQIDSSISRPDSTLNLRPESHGVVHRLIEPLVITVVAGGLLLWLFLQRGH